MKKPIIILAAMVLMIAAAVGGQRFMDSRERPEDYFTDPSTLALASAVMANDRDLVASLVAAGADINAREPSGLTLLHWQVLRNDLSRTGWLLDLGGDPEIKSLHGATAVHIAATKQSTGMLELLLDRGANPDAVSQRLDRTPIFVALDSRNDRHVELLIAHGADIDFADRTGSRPLAHAAKINYARYVRRFLELGADPEATDDLGVTFQPSFFRTNAAILNAEASDTRQWVIEFLTARGIAVEAH
ncbi:MAG: ankyrin repeat domain-containing protein [Aliihoeflea sp.]